MMNTSCFYFTKFQSRYLDFPLYYINWTESKSIMNLDRFIFLMTNDHILIRNITMIESENTCNIQALTLNNSTTLQKRTFHYFNHFQNLSNTITFLLKVHLKTDPFVLFSNIAFI